MLATVASKGAELGAQYGTAAFFITAGIATMSVGGALYPQMMQDQANAAVLDMASMTGYEDSDYPGFTRREYFGNRIASPLDCFEEANKAVAGTSRSFSSCTPVQYEFRLFNLTNPGEVMSGEAKPFVREKGPYVYDVFVRKYDVKFNDNNTIFYRVHKTLQLNNISQFNGLGSSPEDRIITLNVPNFQLLVNLQKQSIVSKANLTETFLAALYANEELSRYRDEIRGRFVAGQKIDGLGRYLTELYRELRLREVPRTLESRYSELLVQEVPHTLVGLYAKVCV
jgi:hypothetical protein